MKLSIKTKVNLWFTMMMILVVGIMMVFMLSISDAVVKSNSEAEIQRVISDNSKYLTYENDELVISDEFVYYANGIDTLIYSKDFALVAGQVPTGYDKSLVPFVNGRLRKAEIGGKDHYVYDTYMYFGKNNGVWIRGIMEQRDSSGVISSMSKIAVIALPLLVLIASIGGYIITKRAFYPVNKIIQAANDIKDGNDLSARIGMGEAKDEIYYLAQTFDKMFERLEVSFASEKEFASNASHELRTPLSVIAGECKYLQGSSDIEEYKESVAVISRQTEKMTDLVNKLLTITRLEQGTHKLNYEEISLGECLDSIAEGYYDNYMNVIINTDVDYDIKMNADISLLARCFTNLIENAIKYNKEGGSLDIILREDENNIYITFKDTGIGIDEEHIDKIFNRFYQADSSRTDNSLGLGLFLTKQIVNLHGGEISLTSRKDIGSSFEIKFQKNVIKKHS